MRFYAEGLLSFSKGCGIFTFGADNDAETIFELNQRSDTPLVYTKISCFLPWIAQQYGLTYTSYEEVDSACTESSGNPDDEKNETCRILPTNLLDPFVGEVECIFPFYYKDKVHNECIVLEENFLFYPTYSCPIRNIT